MTHELAHSGARAKNGGAWGLPAIGAIILALIWGAYTITVVYEIAITPLPAL